MIRQCKENEEEQLLFTAQVICRGNGATLSQEGFGIATSTFSDIGCNPRGFKMKNDYGIFP